MPAEELAPVWIDVALVDGIADMERDGDAVADGGDVADDLLDLADGVGRRGRLRLRVLRRASGEPARRSTRSGERLAPFGATSAGCFSPAEIAGRRGGAGRHGR